MDGSLYEAMVGDFGPTVTFIVVIVLALIAVLRFGVRFDMNKYLESRKQRHARLARLYCPHMNLVPAEKGFEIKSFWCSPSGTLDWVCSQCGAVTHIPPEEGQVKKTAEYYAANPKEYAKKLKRFEKHARKSY